MECFSKVWESIAIESWDVLFGFGGHHSQSKFLAWYLQSSLEAIFEALFAALKPTYLEPKIHLIGQKRVIFS